MASLLTKMLIFLTLMIIGYGFAKKGGTAPGFTQGLSRLVLNVFLCATILNSVLGEPISLDGGELGRAVLVLSVTIGLGYLLAAGTARLLPDKSRRPCFELLMAVPNNMFIALPVLEQAFGAKAVFYCGLSNIPFNLLLYTYGVWQLSRGRGEKGFSWKRMLSAPLIATFAAVLIFVLRLPVPQAVRELVSAMAGATMPLSMIVVGASLSTVSLLDAFKNKHLYLGSLVTLLLLPLAAYALAGLLTEDPVLLATATVVAASPTGIVVTVLTNQFGGDTVFASEGVLQTTALSMLTIPALLYLLF